MVLVQLTGDVYGLCLQWWRVTFITLHS